MADAKFVADARFVADANVCSSAFTPSMEELESDCFSLAAGSLWTSSADFLL